MSVSTQAYVALGSNLGDVHAHLDAAILALTSCDGITEVKESIRYLTDPLGPPDQPDYLNSVCSLYTTLSAYDLLDELQAIEHQQGRVRSEDPSVIASLRWQARTLDLDILLFGTDCIHDERLTVPHVGIAERSFVLQPLFDLNPELVIPKLGPVAELLSVVNKLGIRQA